MGGVGWGGGGGVLLKYTLTTRRTKAVFQTKQNRESRTEQIKTKQKTCKQKGYCLIKKQTDKQTNSYTNQKDPRAWNKKEPGEENTTTYI